MTSDSAGPDQGTLEQAGWLRRILALCVDWAASTFVVIAFMGLDGYTEHPMSGFIVLGTYVAENTLFTTLARGSFGQLVTGLRVVRLDQPGRGLNLLAALLRSVLIALVIPPLIYRPDGRGLHDMAVGSVTILMPKRR